MKAKARDVSSSALIVVVLVLVVLMSGCALTVDKIKVDYTPQSSVQKIDATDSVAVEVGVADIRSRKDRVSSKKNGYGMEMAAIITENDVTELVANAIVAELRNRGFEVGKGSVSVKAELQKFYNDFKIGFFSADAEAEVVINVQIQKPDGSIRFAKVVSGEGKEPNIQLASGTNAKAALERALRDAISKLFNDQEFRDALIKAGKG